MIKTHAYNSGKYSFDVYNCKNYKLVIDSNGDEKKYTKECTYAFIKQRTLDIHNIKAYGLGLTLKLLKEIVDKSV
jgi:hypothetical protein